MAQWGSSSLDFRREWVDGAGLVAVGMESGEGGNGDASAGATAGAGDGQPEDIEAGGDVRAQGVS